MDKIQIINWLLTRRCNLKCEYCAIVKDYDGKPKHYPDMKHYIKNEMSLPRILKGLERFKKHNPDAFHIFYGGEPLLRKDLHMIIEYCHMENIHYTIISNNTPQVRPMIMDLIDKCGKVEGFTASVDPVFHELDSKEDRVMKSVHGMENLIELKKYCKDVVAEITVMKHNQFHLYSLVEELSKNGINSDVTFIDIAKTPYYDFSNITDTNLLVEKSPQLNQVLLDLLEGPFDIHMKEILLPEIWEILPSDMDCMIDRNLHNVSVDADGTIRLCLRIRGVFTPQIVNLENLITSEGELSTIAHAAIKRDKKEFCKMCNHTCQIMSRVIAEQGLGPEELVHLDRRK